MECGKCGGTGNIKSYSHIAGGVCFECNGAGRVNSNGSALEKIFQLYVGHSEDKVEYKFSFYTLEDAIAAAPQAMLCPNLDYDDYTYAEVCRKLKAKNRIKFVWDNADAT